MVQKGEWEFHCVSDFILCLKVARIQNWIFLFFSYNFFAASLISLFICWRKIKKHALIRIGKYFNIYRQRPEITVKSIRQAINYVFSFHWNTVVAADDAAAAAAAPVVVDLSSRNTKQTVARAEMRVCACMCTIFISWNMEQWIGAQAQKHFLFRSIFTVLLPGHIQYNPATTTTKRKHTHT